MGSKSREEILRRIKTALYGNADVRMGGGISQAVEETTELEGVKLHEEITERKQILAERFADEFTQARGTAKVVGSDEEIKEFILALATGRSATSLAIWESDLLRRLNLGGYLEERGFKLAFPGNKEEMAKADIGITEVNFAVAATGTMVLIANKEQPRSVSLIPPVHVAVVKSNLIVENVYDLFSTLKTKYGSIPEITSCMTFITGPSRTADIELNLTLGVHGPKEVFALVCL